MNARRERSRLFCTSIAVAVLVLAATAGSAGATSTECVPANSCLPPPLDDFPALAGGYGYNLEKDWVGEYAMLLDQRFKRPCGRHARCLAVWGNGSDFCRDVLKIDLFAECDAIFESEEKSRDRLTCRGFATAFSGGMGKTAAGVWEAAQQCARGLAEAEGHGNVHQPHVVVEPSAPKPGESFRLVVRAFDDDGDPVLGNVYVDGVQRGLTFQQIRSGFEFRRVYDHDGRVMLSSPVITVTSAAVRGSGHPGWGTVTTEFQTKPSTLRVEVKPQVSSWKRGMNRITVRGFDAATGEELRGKVRTTGMVIGASGTPFDVRLEQGKAGQICGAPLWFAADAAWYSEVDLGVPACE